MKKYIVLTLFFNILQFCYSQNLYFPPLNGTEWKTIPPQDLNWCPESIDSLYQFLEVNNSKAFILLKDGKIVLEQYFNNIDTSSVWYWASAGKSLTAFLVGIAQQDGYFSIQDTTSEYLGDGWSACTSIQEQKITILNQLTMTTGLDDDVTDPYCTDDTCLIYKAEAGTRWAYHNAPYTLLDQIMETATGVTLNQFTTQKLKNITGMTGLFVPSGYNNVFYSNARSMARYGLLILNKGVWNTTPILTDTSYFNAMVNSSQSLNQSYGYLWWLNGKSSFMIPQSQFIFPGFMAPDAPSDMIAALGKNGQFINVIPSLNIVWIRMGDSPESTDVSFLLNNQIWTYINRLSCEESVNEYTPTFQWYPNPASHGVKADQVFEKVILYDVAGTPLSLINDSDFIDLNNFPGGIYFIKTINKGKIYINKVVKIN